MFKNLINFFKSLFGVVKSKSSSTSECLVDIHFRKIIEMEKTPDNDTIGKDDFIFVRYNENPYWVMFQCPCDCGTVISLPLQDSHNPRWTLKTSEFGRPTLYPSVWQNKGCFSHFWITDGKIEMCYNSGIEPWKAEPLKYTNVNKDL
ncbi:MAG: hypothetical protein CBB72_004955 [Muricauda sp. TMED12]|jgi:hypothetical protein|nr:MAG: hypothetical protein CBB72_004955 [Muricauda sp. TMED12]